MMLPDVTLLEAVSAFRQLAAMPASRRLPILKRTAGYFFANPVEMIGCPFLDDRECAIYEHRFFGCRAYGLWSASYYEHISTRDREAKIRLQQQWEKCGVSLPSEIISFRQPYCTDVTAAEASCVDDDHLESVADGIHALSARFSPWHRPFRHVYFSDLSFLLTAAVMGIPDAVQSKLRIVRGIVATGDRTELDLITERLPDVFDSRDSDR